MSPDEKQMLNRALELSLENNRILLDLQKKSHLAMIWGFVKVLIIVVPVVISYFYLQPYFGSVGENLTELRQLLNQ